MIYSPPPEIRALWPTPPLGDWEKRDLNHPIPVAGGDGFTLQSDNISDNDDPKMPDIWANTGVGQPVDTALSGGSFQYAANRGTADRGTYAELTYNKRLPHLVTHSLSREILYNWADAQFNVGGGAGYPLDYGFGPGAHYDATIEMGNVQLYMKPGIYKAPPVSSPGINQ